MSLRQRILGTTAGKVFVAVAALVAVASTIAALVLTRSLTSGLDEGTASESAAASEPPAAEEPQPVASAFEDPTEPGFYGEIPEGFEQPILLTDSEVALLEEAGDLADQGVEESEVYGRIKPVYDERFVPVMNEAITALLANGGTAEGLNFSNVINDPTTVSQFVELVSPYAQKGSDQILELCDTQPNEDGSRNFCGPLQASRVNLNQNIIWDIFNSTLENPVGEEVSLRTAMQPRIFGNKLIVATDGAIRSDF